MSLGALSSTAEDTNEGSRRNEVLLRRLPHIPPLDRPVLPIDVNGPLIACFASDSEPSCVAICVVDWSFQDRSNADNVKGVLLWSPPAGEVSPIQVRSTIRSHDVCSKGRRHHWRSYSGIRILYGTDYSYVACVLPKGAVMIFLIPPLVISPHGDLPRVQVDPLVWTPESAEFSGFLVAGISSWRPFVPANIGESINKSFLLVRLTSAH